MKRNSDINKYDKVAIFFDTNMLIEYRKSEDTVLNKIDIHDEFYKLENYIKECRLKDIVTIYIYLRLFGEKYVYKKKKSMQS